MSKLFAGLLLGLTVIASVHSAGLFANAERQPNDARTIKVALIDMARVFKSTPIFDHKRNALIEQIEKSEVTAKSMQAQISDWQKKLERFAKGSDERTELEEELDTLNRDFEKFKRQQSSKFQKSESVIYRDTYELILKEVAEYSHDHKIDLVLRWDSGPIDDEDPQKMLGNMNRQIIYQDSLDITGIIEKAMQKH